MTAPSDTTPREAAPITALALPAEGAALLVASADGTLVAWDVSGAARTSRVLRDAPDDPVLDLAIDDDRVLAVTERRLLVLDGSLAVRAEVPLDTGVHHVAVTPKAIFVAGDTHVARIARGKKGALEAPVWSALAAGETTDFDVHEGGKRFVVVKDRVHVHVHDALTGASLHVWSRTHRDVKVVSVRYGEARDQLWEVTNRGWNLRCVSAKSGRQAGGEKRWEHTLASAWAGPLALSPDRTRLAVLQTGRDVQLWQLGEDVAATFFAEPVVDRSEGRLLASLSRVPKFAPLGPGMIQRVASRRQPDQDADVVALAVSHGGARIALGDRAGHVTLLDTRSCAIEVVGERVLAEPRCVATRRYAGGVEHGLRDGAPWLLHAGVLAPARFDGGPHEGVALEDPSPGSEYVYERPQLIFRGSLVWRATRVVEAFDVASGRRVHTEPLPGAVIAGDAALAIDWESIGNGSFLLRRFDLSRVKALDPVTVSVSPDLLGRGTPQNWPELHAVGAHLFLRIASGGPYRTFALDAATGTLGAEVDDEVHAALAVDGRHVVVARGERLLALDLDGRDAAREIPLPQRFGRLASLTHHVQRDRIVGWDDGARRIVVLDGEGRLLHHLAGHSRSALVLLLDPSARRLLAIEGAGDARLWRLDA